MRTCFPRYAALLVAVSAVAFGLAGACTTEEGSTPTCVEDLTDDDGGAVANRHLDGGCNPFAICLDDQGNAQAPEACCVDANKQPLTGTELQICLYGYGAANPPTTTSTSTSTSTTGAAGAPSAASGHCRSAKRNRETGDWDMAAKAAAAAAKWAGKAAIVRQSRRPGEWVAWEKSGSKAPGHG